MFKSITKKISPIRLLGMSIIAVGSLTIIIATLAIIGQMQNLSSPAGIKPPVLATQETPEEEILTLHEALSDLEPAAGELLTEDEIISFQEISETITIETTSE